MHFKQCEEELQKIILSSQVKNILEFLHLKVQTPLKEMKNL